MLTGMDARMGLKRSFVEDDADFAGTLAGWESLSMKWNCDQIRRMIRNLIENKEMKVGEFCDAIGNSQNSYRNFMGMSGKFKGQGSDTYVNAHDFFSEREQKGIAPPRKRVKKGDKGAAGDKKDGKGGKDDKEFDVDGVKLEEYEDREATGNVPVFETCDSMRRVINAHLRNTNETQASLARHITAELGRKIQSGQVTSFLGKKGPRSGAESPIFYGGYIYFEKLRIKQGKKKSKFREEMEARWLPSPKNDGETGLPLKDASRIRLITFGNQSWKFNRYGEHEVHGAP